MKNKSILIFGIAIIMIAIFVSSSWFAHCTTQIRFADGTIVGGFYSNPYFIPYGVGMMMLGACLIGFSVLSNIGKKKLTPEFKQQRGISVLE